MAALIGKDGIHHVAGLCELCGEPADPSAEELNALTCTFAQCNASIYHQDCLEKYLKRSGCEKNRKTGFPCPRGRGKAKGGDQCPGRIDKSHPIHPRREDKTKKAKAVEPQAVVKKFGPEAKEARKKKAEAEKRAAEQKHKQAEEEAKKAKAKALPAAKGGKPKNGMADTKKAAQMVDAIRRELNGQPPPKEPVKAAPREMYTLDDYEARKQPAAAPAPAYRPAQPASNAWNAKSQAFATDADKPNLTSSAFPTIPGSKAPPAKLQQPAAGAGQRNWKASLAAQPPEPSNEPSLTTLAAPLPRQPPPPPPRSDPVRDTSAGSAQAVPAITVAKHPMLHRNGTAPSSHSSQVSSGSYASGAAQSNTQHASTVFDSASQASAAVSVSVQHGSAPSLDGFAPATAAQQEAVAQAMLQQQSLQQRAKSNRVLQDSMPGSAKRHACVKKEWENDEELLKECMTQLARFKALCCLYKLCFVGFNAWHCLAAIQQTGIDGDRASIWILDNQLEDVEPDEVWFHEFMRTQDSTVNVDISAEMSILDQVGSCLPAGWNVKDVQISVVESEGDLYSALSTVIETCRSNGRREPGHVGMETAEAVLHGM